MHDERSHPPTSDTLDAEERHYERYYLPGTRNRGQIGQALYGYLEESVEPREEVESASEDGYSYQDDYPHP